MPSTKSIVVRGYLHMREKKGGDGERTRDRRYAVYDPETCVFQYYLCAQDAETDKKRQGEVVVVSNFRLVIGERIVLVDDRKDSA